MSARTLGTLALGAGLGLVVALAVGALDHGTGRPDAEGVVAGGAAAVTTGDEPSIGELSRPAAPSTSTGESVPVTGHFSVQSATERTTRVDVGPKGRSPGDEYFATGRLYDASGNRVVGHQHTRCTVHPAFESDEPSAYELSCVVAFVLSTAAGTQEQLVASGQFIDSGALPVTGTGPYRFVRGQATMGEGRTKDGRDTWTFDLRLR